MTMDLFFEIVPIEVPGYLVFVGALFFIILLAVMMVSREESKKLNQPPPSRKKLQPKFKAGQEVILSRKYIYRDLGGRHGTIISFCPRLGLCYNVHVSGYGPIIVGESSLRLA